MKNNKLVPILGVIIFILICVGIFIGIKEFERYQQKKAVFSMIDDLWEGIECRTYERSLDTMRWIYREYTIENSWALEKLSKIEQSVLNSEDSQREHACRKANEALDRMRNSPIL